jgi:hypothetical protein
MDYGHGVRPFTFSDEWGLMSDPLMGSLLFGTSPPPLDTMAPSLSLPMYVLKLLSSQRLHPPRL